MSIPIASGGGIGIVPNPVPPGNSNGTSQGLGTNAAAATEKMENNVATLVVRSAEASDSGAATGKSADNAVTAGFANQANNPAKEPDTGPRASAIAADISVGPPPAFLTSVLEAATSEAARRDTVESVREDQRAEQEQAAREPVKETPPETDAALSADPTPQSQSNPLEAESREAFNLARSFADTGDKPEVDASA